MPGKSNLLENPLTIAVISMVVAIVASLGGYQFGFDLAQRPQPYVIVIYYQGPSPASQ